MTVPASGASPQDWQCPGHGGRHVFAGARRVGCDARLLGRHEFSMSPAVLDMYACRVQAAGSNSLILQPKGLKRKRGIARRSLLIIA